MRVIAGSARHLQLETPEGLDTRPTTDRTKETLFNILQPYLSGSSFLDLFSGSGGIGIESLSRGAEGCVFVESGKAAMECIRKNLQHTGFTEKSTVYFADVFQVLEILKSSGKTFDFIFMDPPYHKLLEKQVLQQLQSSSLLKEDTWIIVEASLDTDFSYAKDFGFEVFKSKRYKTNQHVFLRQQVGEG